MKAYEYRRFGLDHLALVERDEQRTAQAGTHRLHLVSVIQFYKTLARIIHDGSWRNR